MSKPLGSNPQDEYWEQLVLEGEAPRDREPVLPVMVSIRQWNGNFDWRTRRQMSRTVEWFVRSMLLVAGSGGCIGMDETHILAVLPPNGIEDALARCASVISRCETELSCEAACCVGEPVIPEKLGAMVDRLFALETENVANLPIVQLSHPVWDTEVPAEQLDEWRYQLQDEQFDPLLLSVADYFQRENLRFGSGSLHRLNQDFIQMLYSVMSEKKVPAHILFQRRESVQQFRDAPDSIANTMTWIFCSVTTLSCFLEERRKSQDYTEQARNFILTHLSGNFTRQDIADRVHLSQNHLARVFRQEVGMSISEFALQERMKMAFGLLKNTSLPVGEVAQQVGYENYSYFLSLFRRVAGMTPSQYREKYAGRLPEGGTDHGQ